MRFPMVQRYVSLNIQNPMSNIQHQILLILLYSFMQKNPPKVTRKQNPVREMHKDEAVPDHLKTWLGLTIAIFAFVLYSQSIFFEYTYDDELVIQSNAVVTKGLEGIPTLLKTDFWFGYKDIYRT